MIDLIILYNHHLQFKLKETQRKKASLVSVMPCRYRSTAPFSLVVVYCKMFRIVNKIYHISEECTRKGNEQK